MTTTLRLVKISKPHSGGHVPSHGRQMGRVAAAPHRLRRCMRVWAAPEEEPAIKSNYVESTDPLPDPVAEPDMWDGEKWEWLGKALFFLVPALVVGGVGVGIFAAQTYNEGATVYLKGPTSDNDSAVLFTIEQQPDP